MGKLTHKQQQQWKWLVTDETREVLTRAGFDLQTDFYEVPIVGIMALKDFPYQNIRELIAAMYWGARGTDYSEIGIDIAFYEENPQLIHCADDRIRVLHRLGCFKHTECFYDLTVQQLLSAIYYAPSYIEEYAQYYIMFYERKNLGQALCFQNRTDILKRYTPFSKTSVKVRRKTKKQA